MERKGILYRLIKGFINRDITARFFCDEFTLLFTRYDIGTVEEKEFNKKLIEQERLIYSDLSDWCFKFSEDESDLSKNWYISENELRVKAEEAHKSLETL